MKDSWQCAYQASTEPAHQDRYTEAGFLAIDSNCAEREMKWIAIGRKNWLCFGSLQGRGGPVLVLSHLSAGRHRAVAYLKDVQTCLPTIDTTAVLELLPDRWQAKQTASASAAQENASCLNP